jgi:hypothetical protein
MTSSNQDQRPTGSKSPWDSAIKDRLATLATTPVDMKGLETWIAGEIPRPVGVASGLRKRAGCAPALMIAIGVLAAGLAWGALARGARAARPIDHAAIREIGRP